MLQTVTTLFFNDLSNNRSYNSGRSSSFLFQKLGKTVLVTTKVRITEYLFACNNCNIFIYVIIKTNTDKCYSVLQGPQNRPQMLHFCNKLLQVVTKSCNKIVTRLGVTFSHLLQLFSISAGFRRNYNFYFLPL